MTSKIFIEIPTWGLAVAMVLAVIVWVAMHRAVMMVINVVVAMALAVVINVLVAILVMDVARTGGLDTHRPHGP